MDVRLHCDTHHRLTSASLEDTGIAAHFDLSHFGIGMYTVYSVGHLRYGLNQTTV